MRLFIRIAACSVVLVQPVFAQRADDNPLAEAQDAFGTSVGTESIGLYTPEEVRGFSALEAGNARIDGLYFDLQTSLSDHIIDSSAMRVGISAQGYPLPAPTGIVDYKLRRPGDQRVISTMVSYGVYDGRLLSADVQLPLLANTLSLGFGGTVGRNELEYGEGEDYRDVSVTARWRPASWMEVVPFWNRQHYEGDGPRPSLFVAGSYLPQQYARGQYFGQRWTGADFTGDTFGAIVEAALSDVWSLKGGLFRSVDESSVLFSELYLDVQPDNTARYVIIADPPQRFASTSGEVRLARAFDGESWKQSVQLALRGRDQHRRYGGSDEIEMGTTRIGEAVLVERPELSLGEQNRDHVKQTSLGIAWHGRTERAEISLGVQKVDYRKEVVLPAPEESTTGTDRPMLFNAGGTFRATEALSFYASYARGLEEGGVAPAAAVNRDSAPPAIKTEQMDAGLRYALAPNLRVIAGVFDISKPYYSLDAEGIYRELGDQRHRGLEVSLSGEVTPRTNIALGAVLMRPRVEGELVDTGAIGRKPVGQTARTIILNGEYRLATVSGLSFNTDIVSYGRRMASSDNTLEIPSRIVVGAGARYQFGIKRARATARLHVGNVFNNFGWRTNASGVFEPNAQRSVMVNFAADF